MHRIHHHLCKKSAVYHQWHQHPLHRHVHWGVLGAVALGVALSFVILGWSEVEVATVQVARAQIGTSFFPAFPGSTYEQRKQAYIANQDRAWEQWFPGAMRHALWAWLERPQGNEAKISQEIEYYMADREKYGIGWKNNWWDGDHHTPIMAIRMYVQYYLENKVISDADAQKIKDRLRIGTTFNTWCAVANYKYRYLAWAYLYTTLIEDVGKVEFPQPSNDRYACPQPFTYQGRTYQGGVQYESRDIYRDYLSKEMDRLLRNGDQEDFSPPYYYAQVHSMAALADFAPDEEIRRKGKVLFDFLVFNWAAAFSANHPGGAHGRHYVKDEKPGKMDFPWVVFFDLYGKADIGSTWNYADAYVFKNRFPQLLTDIVEAKGEGDDYYRIIRGHMPAWGMTWWEEQAGLLSSGYRYDYITKYYNLGGAGHGTGWELNIEAPSVPMKLWIDTSAEVQDPTDPNNPHWPNIPLFNLGQYGYQHRNALFYAGGGYLHQWIGDNTWDEQSNESGWQFFRKGVVGVAVQIGGNTSAVEVATIGVDYPTYDTFKAAIKSNTSLSSGGFRTSKGFTITPGYVDYGSDFSRLPFDRLEVWEGHVGRNDERKIVNWNNNMMTVSRGGSTCEYNFNSWTYSGDCGGTSTPPPKTCTTPTCTTTAGCAGTCSADQTYCIDVANDNCPAGVGSCGVPGASCSLDSCLGKCDSSGNTCVKTDPSCGGEGSCPTTCITMGGDTCSDSLQNATELPACSTAYCAPNYAPKSYCVKCNPGSTLNPATDRCEAGSTQNQPPRNLVLRYLGPTPIGGNLCGNPPGRIDPSEQCDGANLNNQTCQSQGFSGGTLACTPSCTFNTSGCSNPPAQVCTPNQTCASCYTSQNCAGVCNAQGTAWVDANPNDGCPNYSQGHTYPRLSAFTWGGAVPWYYAQLDLIDTGNSNPAFAQAIKALNPNTRVVVTKDIQAGFSEAPLPQEWRARASRDYNGDGKPDFCVIYGGSQESGPYYYDITDAAPLSAMPQTNCGTYCGQRYNQYIDDLYRQTVDLSVFDGVATDGLWDRYSGGTPCDSDIDLDRNGQNDYSERGKQGVDNQISAGALKMIQGMRSAAGPNKLVIVNSGGPHTYGMQDSNGFIHEHFIGHFGFDWNKGVYENWMANGVQPVTPIVNTDTVGGSPITPHRNDFPLMRYGLTFALVTGSYFDFTDYDRAGEHYWVKYYDEYDTNLGYPLGPAQKTASGAWVRFFDNGMAVTNGSDTDTVTVRVSEVRGMTGYNPGNTGFYHRFRGGQDVAVNGTSALNNGNPFDGTHPIVLKNRQQLGRDAQGELHPAQADGIILLREPAAIVSNIIIDNWNSGTSPGSRAPGDYYEDRDAFSGFTQAADPVGDWCRFGSDYYTTRCSIYFKRDSANNYMKDARGEFIPSEFYHSPPFATAPANSSARAVYTPNIGVAGQYRIYEWHGRLSSGTLASNARYVIDAAPVAAASNCTTTGVSATCTVNQQVNSGQWNSLGTYRFTTTGGENVSILASGANGTVMADAIRFEYIGP